MRAAWAHCAFFAASVQRPKLLAAPATLLEFASAMHASQAALPFTAGGVVAGGAGVAGVAGVVGLVVGVVGVLAGPTGTTGVAPVVEGDLTVGVGGADSSGLISVSVP